jgi:calcineurin-like phosphoesterase family protein
MFKEVNASDFNMRDQEVDVWFTSDTHFDHINILKYCNRDYKDVVHMNESLIKNWNNLVKPGDLVYHLGDVSFKTDKFIHRLNGDIVLISGNHDKKKYNHLFHGVVNSMSLQIGEFNCYLTHRPIIKEEYQSDRHKNRYKPDFSLLDRYDMVLCGHVHQAWKTNGKNINMSVEVWDYKPVHIDDLIQFMRDLEVKK